jgi:metal-sulfur cluster biosynthetic enzyme
MDRPTDDQIREVLREVDDPEIGINIVDLGLIYGVEISDSGVLIRMTMTTPACPLHEYLSTASQDAIRKRFPDVGNIDIQMVWDPPWDPVKMSPAAKQQLGW